MLYVRVPTSGSSKTLSIPTALIIRKSKKPWPRCLREVTDVRSLPMGKAGSSRFFLVAKTASVTARTALTDVEPVVSMMELRVNNRLAGFVSWTLFKDFQTHGRSRSFVASRSFQQ